MRSLATLEYRYATAAMLSLVVPSAAEAKSDPQPRVLAKATRPAEEEAG